MTEDAEKRYSKKILGKTVVSKSGKKYGEVGNLTFETRTGELLHIVVARPTGYIEGLDLEKDESGKPLIPFSSVVAIGDFIVISEEDMV